MNKQIFFSIVMLFLLGIAMIGQAEAASYNDNSNVFSSFSLWMKNLFSKSNQETSVKDASNTSAPINSPYIVLSPSYGDAGDTVKVSLYNFPQNNVKYTLLFDGLKVKEFTSGVHTISFLVPNKNPGTYKITVPELAMSNVHAYFTINAKPQPYIVLTPTSGPAGTEITVRGYNLQKYTSWPTQPPYPTYTIMFGNDEVKTFTRNADGQFKESFIVSNDVSEGTYKVKIKEAPIAYSYFTVTSSGGQAPQIWVYPTEGYVDDEITVYGSGFEENSSDILIRFDDILLGYADSDSEGNFSFETNVPMPNDDQSVYIIEAVNVDGNSAYTDFTILWGQSGNPELFVYPDEGYAGDTATVYGYNFTYPAVPYEMTLRMAGQVIAQFSANESEFAQDFVVPDIAAGTYMITADGFPTAYDYYTVLENGTQPDLTLIATPDEGYAGDVIDLEGTGYQENTTLIIFMDPSNPAIIATPETDENGDFETTFVVPEKHPDTYLINVYDLNTSVIYAVEEEFTILENGTQPDDSELFVDPDEGYAEDVIDIWGNDFGPNETLVIMMAGQVIATPTTDSNGEFADIFTVPDVAAGIYTITVQGYDATAQFEVLDNGSGDEDEIIFVDPSIGYPGDVVDVFGYNFTPNTNLTIYLGPEFVVTVMTDSEGSFFGQFIVPDIDAGLYDVMVIGSDATTPFLVLEEDGDTPDLFVNPDNGYAGDIIIISGINFGENEDLVIYMDGQVIVIPTTDSNGAFIDTFTVPNWDADDYVITVFGYNVSEDFTINEDEDDDEDDDEDGDDNHDDDEDDNTPREQHQYYIDGLTCNENTVPGTSAKISFDVVNNGISDEDNMILSLVCQNLGINRVYEGLLIERLEPNHIEIPVQIPAGTAPGEYSCMIELYSEDYAYEKLDRVTDSLNIIVGGTASEDIGVIYLANGQENAQKSESGQIWLFVVSLLLLGLITFFVYKIYALTRA